VRYQGATGVEVLNNLLDAAIQPRDGALPTVAGNLGDAVPSWFVDMDGGDLHLAPDALPALDQVTRLTDAMDDFDGQVRPADPGQADIGADESATTDLIFANGFD